MTKSAPAVTDGCWNLDAPSPHDVFHLLHRHTREHPRWPNFYKAVTQQFGIHITQFFIHETVRISPTILEMLKHMPQLELLYLVHCELLTKTGSLDLPSVRALAVDVPRQDLKMLSWALQGCPNIVVLHVLLPTEGPSEDWKSGQKLDEDLGIYRQAEAPGLRCLRISRPADRKEGLDYSIQENISLDKVERYSVFAGGSTNDFFRLVPQPLLFFEARLTRSECSVSLWSLFLCTSRHLGHLSSPWIQQCRHN
ncbi:hypothetical protein C8J56DRAFT_63045 [Mycena floridula]|nr:hypothetical protein C8J56DRAFT_63045 [Mycena floridula]